MSVPLRITLALLLFSVATSAGARPRATRWIRASETASPHCPTTFRQLAVGPGENWTRITSSLMKGTPLKVPESKRPEAEALVKALERAPSFRVGVRILKKFMKEAGIIQTFPVLKLSHGAALDPKTALTTGLLSIPEQVKHGVPLGQQQAQTNGHGIYCTGRSPSWPKNRWGTNVYDVELRNARVLVDGGVGTTMFSLYRGLQYKFMQKEPPQLPMWAPRPADEGLRSFDVESLFKTMGITAYTDAFRPEVVVKSPGIITPQQITAVHRKR